MTHDKFVWVSSSWTFDYQSHFKLFQEAISNAMTLYFPDYTLDWVLRTDASDLAVGSVLFQIFKTIEGLDIYQPISFTSKRLSGAAVNWDTYKKEAYGIFEGVNSNAYYLLGKSFKVQTDHRNLQFIEQSKQPIIIRWRNLLQSFDFIIEHIPGRENCVADFLSRLPESTVKPHQLLVLDNNSQTGGEVIVENPSFNAIMNEVHGGRSLHFGSYETWRLARARYPTAKISLLLVQTYVKECPMCQKTRDTGIRGLKSQTLNLKPDTYRRSIGIDHVTVTPMDKNGNTCAITIVEHFSHFPQIYAAPTYDVIPLATAIFKHACTFGMFEQVSTDPGSTMMAEAIVQVNKWLGVTHKISLVGRHESNGCEGTNKQFLRHLKTLVFDERLINDWSGDTVLPLINFSLASYPTSETGGFTPFQLKYGTIDATYFHLPTQSPQANAAALLLAFDNNLKTVRELSLQFQQKLVNERKKADGPNQCYESGDLLLWNRRENPGDMLPSKLSPPFLGPYRVVKQHKNDITCVHVVSNDVSVLHMDRVKPFFGSDKEAYEIAKLDKDQFDIMSINYFTGNPNMRSSLLFNVTFEGYDTRMLPYNIDLSNSAPFIEYINSNIILFPLRTTAAVFSKYKTRRNKIPITTLVPATAAFLHLRYYDKSALSWYDKLLLPQPTKEYYIHIDIMAWGNNAHTLITVFSPLFNTTFSLTPYEVMVFVILADDVASNKVVVVTPDMLDVYTLLKPWVEE